MGAGETVLWLSVLAVLVEDLGSIFSTYIIVIHTQTTNTLFWSPWALDIHVVHILHIHKMKKKIARQEVPPRWTFTDATIER